MAKKPPKKDADPSVRNICENRRARHDYEVEERIEAGLVLRGSEVKSVRDRKAHLSDAYALIEDGEAWLVNSHIDEYVYAHRMNHVPRRNRKLLLHAQELKRLTIKLRERGYTLVPLRLYFRGPHVKVELGLARGRKSYDKREAIRERDQAKEQRRELSRRDKR